MAHALTNLLTHVVFSTHGRAPLKAKFHAGRRDPLHPPAGAPSSEALFKDEFLALLRKHDLEFDERYLWR